MIAPDLVTRGDVRVSRAYGWVVDKRSDSIVGCVWSDVNAAGAPIWKASSGDVSSFAFKRADAIARVIELHNMQEKARTYDLLARCSLRNTRAVAR